MKGEVVYADVLFIINFSMDFLILFSAGKLLHLRARALRLSLAAATGALYCIGSLFIRSNPLLLLCNILSALIICLIAYGKQDVKTYIRLVLLFLALSALLGGAVTAMYSAIDRLAGGANINSATPSELSDIPLWLFILLGAVSVLLSYVTGRIFRAGRSRAYANLEVSIDGRKQSFYCMIDSGNTLKEPISSLPVAVVAESALTEEMREVFLSLRQGETPYPIRVIPTKTVTGSALLYGTLPDKVYVNGKERRCVVAACEFETNRSDGLIPAELI